MKITINGVNYHYKWLKKENIASKTLVCLHGFTGSGGTFSFLEETTIDMNIITIDIIGHGCSDSYVHPYRYQIQCLCSDIFLLLQELEIHQFSLLGYSMGARVAMNMAMLFPEQTQGLILEGGSPGIENDVERQKRKISDQHLAQFLISHPIEEFVQRWEQLPLFYSQRQLPQHVQQVIRRQRLSQQSFGLACSLWFMGTGVQKNLWPDLDKLKRIPTLLIVGERDTKFVAIAEKIRNLQPQFSLLKIGDSGHCVHVEKPLIFRQELEKWLADN